MHRIVWLLVLALVVGLVPAMADTWAFSFTAVDSTIAGTGTLGVNAGVIDALAGTLVPGGAMTLLAPGAFASNDNVFVGAAPWVTENGFSFQASGMNYNIYYFATSNNYIATGCPLGDTCVTGDPYGVPSTPINFSASLVPAPEPMTLLLLGMMGTLVLGVPRLLRRK